MLLNSYETTVGKQYKVIDNVESAIKTLHLTRNLPMSKKEGVYILDHTVELNIPLLAFPISIIGFNKQRITVLDERPFRQDKTNKVVHHNDLIIQRLAAFMQQDVYEGNEAILKGGRIIATKGFAESVSSRIIRRAGLDPNESLTLKVILAHYFVLIGLTNKTESSFVAANVIRSIYGSDASYINAVVENLTVKEPVGLQDLLTNITEHPTLFKTKNLDLKDLIAVVSGITFSAMGGKVSGAACESPILFTALVYGAVKFKALGKAPLGMSLDPKYNRQLVEGFLRHIEYSYDLSGE